MFKKALGAFAAIALVVSVSVPAVSAMSASAIEALLIGAGVDAATAATLAAALGDDTTPSTSGSCALKNAPDMTLGAQGANVIELQNMLIASGDLVIPAGVSKGYFGVLTQSALAKYQARNNISPAAGYFGPITRASIVCDTTSTPDDKDEDESSSKLKGGAGDIDVTKKTSGVEDEVLEGEEEVNVLGFEIEANGSDVEITSIKVQLKQTDSSGSGSDRLNRYVDEVLIMMGDEVVGSADADDFSESSDIYTKSISLSGAIIEEDETEKFYVAVTALNNIDSKDLKKDWTVTYDSARYKDGEGAILTDSTNLISEVFTFKDLSTAGNVKLTVREGNDKINRARTEPVDDILDTKGVKLLSFTIEADGSDMELQSMTINATSSDAGVMEIVSEFRLMMDGAEVGTVSTNESNSASTTVAITISDLDDDDVVIEEGDKVEFTLEADINDIGGNFGNGDSLSVISLDADDVDADDENGDTVTVLKGSVESSNIKFASEGVMTVVVGDPKADSLLNDDGNSDNQGKFVFEIEVSAFEKPAYIALTGSSTAATSTSDAGVYAYVEDLSDATITTGTTTVTVERISGGTVSGNYVKINHGSSAVLRVSIYHDAASTVFARGQIHAVNFAETQGAGTSQHLTVPAEDYQSPSGQILN